MSTSSGGPAAYPDRVATAPAVIPDDRRTYLLNRASWGAIFAGIAAALVIQAVLNILGIGVGLASFDISNTADNPDAGTFSLAAAIWWIVAGIIASFIGGMIAGRLCGAAKPHVARLHGFVAWCGTTLVIFWLLTTAIGGIVGGTFSALGSTLGGVGKAAASAVGGVAQNANGDALEARVRSLVNPSDAQSVQNSIVSYIRAIVSGDQQQAQASKDEAVNGLARVANISPDEARGRVDQLTQQYQQTAQRVKQQASAAAEVARKRAAQAGIYGFIALVLGAIAAWFGGGLGTPRRETSVIPTTAADRAY